MSPNAVPLITSSSRPPRWTFAHGAPTSGFPGGATLGGVISVSIAAVRHHPVHARCALDHVARAVAGVDHVVARAGADQVAARAREDRVVAGAADEHVALQAAVQDVVSVTADQAVAAVASPEAVVAAVAVEDVVALAAP